MARTKQQLINYHTGSKTAQPGLEEVKFGEIVVRHNFEQPELLIKVSSGTSGQDGYGEWFVPFVDKKEVLEQIAASITASEGTLRSEIETLSSSTETLSASVVTKYATSANTEAAIEKAKIEAEIASSAYTDSQILMLSGITSAYVGSFNTALDGRLKTVESDVEKLKTFSATVESDYATKEFVGAASGYAYNQAKTDVIGTAEDEANANTIYGAKAYADGKVKELSGSVETRFTGVNEEIESLKTFSGKVESDYATKAEVGAASAAAVTSAYTALLGTAEDSLTANTIYGAKAYTDEKVKGVSGDMVTYVDTLSANVVTAINQKGSDVSTLSGNIETLSGSVVTMSADVKTYIDNELSKVYNVKGSVANKAALDAVENPKIGDVYNVIAANGEPGDSDYTPAGTNYVWNGSEWDALGGTVDLSNYATTAVTDGLNTRVTALESKSNSMSGVVETLSGAIETLSASVIDNYALSSNTHNEIEAAKLDAEIASSAYTDSQIQMLSGITSAYVTTELSTVKSDVSDLKAFTANTAATHAEVAAQSAATFESAFTAAVSSAESHTDAAITALKGNASESADTLGELEAYIHQVAEAAGSDTSGLQSRIGKLEVAMSGVTESAETWNKAILGAEFGEVQSTDSHYDGGEGSGATVDSNAKLSYTEGGKIVLDLSELIIDCGEFE